MDPGVHGDTLLYSCGTKKLNQAECNHVCVDAHRKDGYSPANGKTAVLPGRVGENGGRKLRPGWAPGGSPARGAAPRRRTVGAGSPNMKGLPSICNLSR